MKQRIKSWIKDVWENEVRTKSNSSTLEKFHYDSFFDSVLCPGPFYFYVLNYNTHFLEFISPSVTDVLGSKAKNITLSGLFNRIHPSDVDHVNACDKMAIDFLDQKILKDQLLNYKISYSFRLKHDISPFKHILSQFTAISQVKGKLLQVVGVHCDISHITTQNDKCISFLGINGAPSFVNLKPSSNVSQIQPNDKALFSDRELEIIRLFSEGMSAADTADELTISVETVRTHRKNILAKTDCKNITELVVKCLREELI